LAPDSYASQWTRNNRAGSGNRPPGAEIVPLIFMCIMQPARYEEPTGTLGRVSAKRYL